MVSLTSLPVEILCIIVRMARDQDAHLKQRLVTSTDRVVLPTKEVMKLSEWYGISLFALRSTCKTIESLANPLVFESIRQSRCFQDIFFDLIVPKYASLVKTVIVDSNSVHGVNNFEEVFMSLQDLPTLQRLIFETQESVGVFQAYYISAHRPTAQRITADSRRRYFRPHFASLFHRVAHLVCLEVTASDMEFFIEHFTNLKSITRRLYSKYADGSEDVERKSYATLKQLEELDILTLSYQDEQNLRRAKEAPVTFKTLTCDEWKILQNFRLPLERLTLSGIYIEEALWSFEEEVGAFPRLSTLNISGNSHLVTKVLRLLKMAPLKVLDVKLFGFPIKRDKILEGNNRPQTTLHHFATTLKCLKWKTSTVSYGQGFILSMEAFTAKNNISFEFGGPEEALLLSDIAEYSLGPRETASLDDRRRNEKFYEEVCKVASYAVQCASNALRNDGVESLQRVATLLRPLTAMQLIDLE